MGLLFIDRFFLPERMRKQGLGTQVIKAAEGARCGCTRGVLFTVHFQASGLYERQGYEVLGRLECDPPRHTGICLTKRLSASS
jgi:GNAT superfamily N-acetyltransferase